MSNSNNFPGIPVDGIGRGESSMYPSDKPHLEVGSWMSHSQGVGVLIFEMVIRMGVVLLKGGTSLECSGFSSDPGEAL